MINPKELRIGNYVQDSEGVLGVIRLVASDLVYVNHFNGYAIIDPIFGSELNPIPLTEEWLILFGFEKGSDNQYYKNSKFTIYQRYDKYGLSGGLLSWNEFKHVHQLQNLYFALTGEELTIATADPQQ